MTTSSEIASIEQADLAPNLFGASDPVAIVGRATSVAKALADVIKTRNLANSIQGREYVRCEGWTLLGTMLGVFPICVWTRPLEDGYEARVEARTLAGQVVGAAEAMCTRSESNWKSRDDYALRSMAQTRATAKALRLPLGFVMSLAGYDPTPAEEATEDDSARAGGRRRASSEASQATPPSAPLPATEAQIKRLRALAEKNHTPLKTVCDLFSVDKPEQLTVEQANEAIRRMETSAA